MEEVWKDIPGYEGYYEVSTLGRVRGVDRMVNSQWNESFPVKSRYLSQCLDRYGYKYVVLSKEHKIKHMTVHRAVAITFIQNHCGKPCIDHIDGNKTNNRVDNLRWCTVRENNRNPITIQRHKEIVFTEERNRKISNGLLGHRVSEETRKKIADKRRDTARGVAQYTLSGELVNTWKSSRDAAKDLLLNHNTMVSIISRGKRSKGYYTNYIFKYINK